MEARERAAVAGAIPSNDILRFITCGSVDDGKSTLIGRLLHDTQLIMEDQLAALARDSVRYGTTGKDTDFALLLDGLEAEREQGITIDVAHRYFTTPRRSFVSIDTPGHEQYTRNMAMAASNADVAVILIDARNGVQVQTKRHSFICALLGIRNVVLAINKIDLVDFRKAMVGRQMGRQRSGVLNASVVPTDPREKPAVMVARVCERRGRCGHARTTRDTKSRNCSARNDVVLVEEQS